MAGKITADTLEHSTAGSVDTQYVVNGSAKAWAVLNDANTASPDLPDSFNTSSSQDLGTGSFYINWTNDFSSGDYSACASGRQGSTDVGCQYSGQNASRIQLLGRAYNSNSNTDYSSNMVAAFGDLA